MEKSKNIHEGSLDRAKEMWCGGAQCGGGGVICIHVHIPTLTLHFHPLQIMSDSECEHQSGLCLGDEDDKIQIESSDKRTFLVERKYAFISAVIKAALETGLFFLSRSSLTSVLRCRSRRRESSCPCCERRNHGAGCRLHGRAQRQRTRHHPQAPPLAGDERCLWILRRQFYR